jgi:cysteine dioxygenase
MENSRSTLNEFIDRLNRFAERAFPLQEVQNFLQQCALGREELGPYLFFDSAQYTRNLIHNSQEFELLAICWQPGQEAPVHGHEGERCWSRVEKGKLRFTNYLERSAADSFDLKVLSTSVGTRGHVDGPADIHKVENPFQESAVSLHLYSRPFSACDIYDLENRMKVRKTLGYFSKYGEPC